MFVDFPKEMNEMVGMKIDQHFELSMRQDNVRMDGEFSDFYGSLDTCLYVQGPPGVGKTKEAALFVVSSLQPNRVHAWVRLQKGGSSVHKVYVLEKGAGNNEINCTQVFVESSAELVRVLLEVKCTLVVFDNCNKGNMEPVYSCRELRGACKVIAVSSLQVKRDKSDATERAMEVNGWELKEYLDACKNDDFYNLVKANLQTDGYTEEDLDNPELRSEIVEAKHYLAGGSARWMFEYSAAELLEPIGTSPRSIVHHVRQASRAEVEKGFGGDRSVSAVNHLLSRFGAASQIVSKYVAALLLKQHGTDLLRAALLVLGHHPAVDGVMMELDFYGRLGLGTQAEPNKVVEGLLFRTDEQLATPLLSGSQKIVFTMATLLTMTIDLSPNNWFSPEVFNNGGFDFVQYVLSTLIFVQVTRSPTHSYNLRNYKKFYDLFCEKYPDKQVTKCEVWFVVEEEHLETFVPKPVLGSLPNFNHKDYKVVGLHRVVA